MTEHPLLEPGKPYSKQWIKGPAGFVCRFLIQDYASWGVCSPLKSSRKSTQKGKKMDIETPSRHPLSISPVNQEIRPEDRDAIRD
jgi:hypothetical protein